MKIFKFFAYLFKCKKQFGYIPKKYRLTVSDIVNEYIAYSMGYRRIAPFGATGRIYETQKEQSNVAKLLSKGKLTITPSKVYKADEGRWYDFTEYVAKQEKENS